MLSDEEKEAIETVKFFKKMKWYSHAFDNGTEILSEDEKQDIDIVLNLIEKQSKEIEELKENTKKCEYYEMVADELYKNSVSKDKIKAKIEELKEDIKYSANPLSIDNSKFGIKVLQSLLEKE